MAVEFQRAIGQRSENPKSAIAIESSEGVNWGMGWVVVGTAVFGVPRFLAKTLENKAFFHKKMQNRGAPKTAVPTTTDPIPQLTPS